MKNTTPSLLLPPPLLMVLLLVLSHSPGGSLNPLLAPSCSADIIISGVEVVALLSTKMPRKNLIDLYVHPEPDFRGISLVAKSDNSGGGGDGAWFPLEKECFQVDADWWELSAVVYIRNRFEEFFVRVGRCAMQCTRPRSFSRIVSLQVSSYGPSKWRFSSPHQDTDCTMISPIGKSFFGFLKIPEPTQISLAPHQCTKPPEPHQYPQSSILVVVVVSVVATVGVLVLVIIVIVTANRLWHRKTATTTASTAVNHTQAQNQAPTAEPSTSRGYNDDLYDDVLNTQAPNQALAMGLGASRDNENDLYDDVVNFHDVEAIYDKIEEVDVYLIPIKPKSGGSSVKEE